MIIRFTSTATSITLHILLIIALVAYCNFKIPITRHESKTMAIDITDNFIDLSADYNSIPARSPEKKNKSSSSLVTLDGDTKLISKDNKIYAAPDTKEDEQKTVEETVQKEGKNNDDYKEQVPKKQSAPEQFAAVTSIDNGLIVTGTKNKDIDVPKSIVKKELIKHNAPPLPIARNASPSPVKRRGDSNMDRVLQSIKQYKQESSVRNKGDSLVVSKNNNTDTELVLHLSNYVQNEFTKCWNIPAAAQSSNIAIHLEAYFDVNGNVVDISILGKPSSDPLYETIENSAVRAVKQCSPLEGMPTEKYQLWNRMKITFSPKNS